MGAVQHAFHFLDGPADVLRASTASRRWRELACAGVVWRPKAVREGVLEKAGVFGGGAAGGGRGSGGRRRQQRWRQQQRHHHHHAGR